MEWGGNAPSSCCRRRRYYSQTSLIIYLSTYVSTLHLGKEGGGGIFPTGSPSILSVPLHLLIDNMDARVQLVTLSRRTVSSCPPRPSLDRRRRRVVVLMEFS